MPTGVHRTPSTAYHDYRVSMWHGSRQIIAPPVLHLLLLLMMMMMVMMMRMMVVMMMVVMLVAVLMIVVGHSHSSLSQGLQGPTANGPQTKGKEPSLAVRGPQEGAGPRMARWLRRLCAEAQHTPECAHSQLYKSWWHTECLALTPGSAPQCRPHTHTPPPLPAQDGSWAEGQEGPGGPPPPSGVGGGGPPGNNPTWA